jgi:hypothetical protein
MASSNTHSHPKFLLHSTSLALSLALLGQAGCGDDTGQEGETDTGETIGDGDGDGDATGDGDGDATGDGDGDATGDGDGDATGDGDGDTGAECTADEDCASLTDACNLGACVDGACVGSPINEGEACDDGNLCTATTTCTEGVCGGGTEPDCSDLDDQCNAGACDPDSGQCAAMPANEGEACDDEVVCTYDDVCSSGTCAGVSDPLFTEDFSVGDGWMTEGKWEIGVAVVSAAGSISGLTDPAEDSTDTDDNRLAGVAIGGLSSGPGHDPQYLTSPVIDLSVLDADAAVELEFQRWLVAAGGQASETIDVWDGTAWVNVFLTAAALDDAWLPVSIDVSQYKNADFQVRFGHALADIAVLPSEPSWSVDDIQIVPVCE